MASNLVSIIAQIFNAPMLARIAASLGISPATAQSLSGAAVPAVLAVLGKLAATPGGAQKIADQIQSQDSNLLGTMVNALGSPNQSSFLASGNGIMSSLLGGGAPNTLAAALARATGAEQSQAQSMIGLVTPAVFGALAQQDPALWSTGSGIAGLFQRESDAITSALPQGLAEALDDSGLLASSGSAEASPVVNPQADAPAPQDRLPVDDTASPVYGGIPGWLKIALPAAVLAALAWFMIAPAPTPSPAPPQQAPQTPAQPGPSTPSAAQQAAAQIAEFAAKTNGTLSTITSTLAGITTAEQAPAAVPRLEQSARELSELSRNFSQLPPTARSALAGPMQSALNALSEQSARAMAVPGVAETLRPVIDRITTAVANFKE